jgi:hypothetical protein
MLQGVRLRDYGSGFIRVTDFDFRVKGLGLEFGVRGLG